ncbi:hypothetical protein KSS87_003703 [Heliosperma pusillum]|nr:hypothetical protein KSS87_003703 [Heliosperma pusillum]
MAGVCEVVLTGLRATKSFVYGNVKEYVGYIGNCEDNLNALRKSLSEVCNKKDDMNKKVNYGEGRLEEITRGARSWLKDVRILTEDEELKGLMYKDIETAKYVVKMMGNKSLKWRIIREGSEMQELVIKVMNKLREEMDMSDEEMGKIAEEDYKQVAEVVVEVMKDKIDEFKTLLKQDKNMAAIAIRTLKDRDLDKLTKDDEEMKETLREAENAIDEELLPNHVDDESNARQPLLVNKPEMCVRENIVKEAAKKLFAPLTDLVTPLGKLMDGADFKKAVPHAEDVKLGLEVIDGLLIKGHGSKKEMVDVTKRHRGCCCSPLSLCCYYHDRYLISKAAKFMAKHMQDELISKCPQDPVTLPIRTVDLKPIPSQFLEGLDSRTQLLHQILEKLLDDQVDSIGLFGMGGIEVIKRVKDAFTTKVMVEVSDAPDFLRIQAEIAESINLPLHDVTNVAQRAIKLYNRLISEKEEKILIILDNVWKKLNLDDIGIPRTCKILFTTRDRDVCRVMDVKGANILEVGLMNTHEARELFKRQTRNQANFREYKNVAERLLNKCGGLPLAIVATANSLKDKELSSWEKFANDLEMPISSQISGDYRHTFSVLSTSYKFIQPDGKRLFFLLASLSPRGSTLSIDSLLRYGIGLNLFEHVNKLSEAMEQAVTWATELVLSSMLLEGDVKGNVKIHDIVRDFAIAYATKEEEHKFMVEGIPRWLDDKTLKKYTAMSLTSKKDYYRLSGVEAYKLQILILKGDLSSGVDESFFNGMVKLEVLSLSNMNFQPSLPESMKRLKELRTLFMEDCKLGNIELVGELVDLLVLSLRDSFVESVPNEVGNLRKLRLLDLRRCTTTKLPLIPNGVLSKLSSLEGLYIDNFRESDFKSKSDCEAENITENIKLPCLNALEIKVAKVEELLAIDAQLISNLDKFRISIGHDDSETSQKFGCNLNLNGIDKEGEFLKTSCLKVLLRKADFLEIKFSRNFADLVPQLDEEGFRSLKYLNLLNCSDIKCIVDGGAVNNVTVFPSLQSLVLFTLPSLEMVCNGDVSPGTFSNLQKLRLMNMNTLLYGLPLVPRNVNHIDVKCCALIKFIFLEDHEEIQAAHELPFLKKLKLFGVPRLLSLFGPKSISNTDDSLQGPRYFFDEKIVLPSLEVFILGGCENVVALWSMEFIPGFQNLKDIQISDCENLSSFGSSSVISTLVRLETLSINNCKHMVEVVSFERTEESEVDDQTIRFPQLKHLEINYLDNLESFYGGGSKLEFPKLKILILTMLGSLKKFGKSETSSALFHDKITFPCLEELQMRNLNDEVTEIWDKQSLAVMSNPLPMLRQLSLTSSIWLRQIPSIILENLSSLTLTRLQDEDVVFSSSCFGEKERFLSIGSQLPNLKELKVRGCESLKELFRRKDHDAIDDALTLFCGQIKTLELYWVPLLNIIPLPLFKSITSLNLYNVKWNYLIPANVLEDSLHQLQILEIYDCANMEALVIDVGSHIKLPSLKQLNLYELRSFIGISSTPKKEAALFLPLLESLDIVDCDNLEHFWSGPIVAPRLHDLCLSHCDNLQQFLVGNPKDTIDLPSTSMSISLGSVTENPNHNGDLQLPSMEIVKIRECPNLRSFCFKRVVTPKLIHIMYNGAEYSMLPYDNLNHFLQILNPTSISKDDNFDKD